MSFYYEPSEDRAVSIDEYNDLLQQVEELKAQNEKLKKALQHHGAHEIWCEYLGDGECNCGLDEIAWGE